MFLLKCKFLDFTSALFKSFSNWDIKTTRLLDPTICLPHKDGSILLSALPTDTTSKLPGFFYTLPLLIGASTSSKETVDIIFKDFHKI